MFWKRIHGANFKRKNWFFSCKINKEKYEKIVEKYNEENRFKDSDVVVFQSSYWYNDSSWGYGDSNEIAGRGFTVWPENSNDYHDYFHFSNLYEGDNVNKYFDFVKEIIGCIIGPDEKSIIKLLEEKDKAINELKSQYNEVKSLLNSENLVK